jgi:DNA polymerase type B, organellar and viral
VSRAKPFYTVDCETDPFKVGRIPVPFIWGVYRHDTEEYWEFETPADVVSFLAPLRVVVYAHNGGKFDYHYLREYINSDDPLMVIAGRLAKFKIGEAEFRDSWNLLNEPLKVFAKEDFDYTKLEPDVRERYRDEIRRYLKSDCVNLANTLAEYFARYGRTITQASASMRYWKEHYKVPFIPQTVVQSVYYRDFYYGGRVQCFESGHAYTNFNVVDINSAYPFAMLHQHPISAEGVLENHLPADDKIGPCLIRLDAVARGCFPLRAENGELFFPEDEHTIREYAITGWELLAALECDAVKIFNIKEVRRFPHTVNFHDYIHHFYDERLKAKANGDKLGDLFAKRFMNGLYGKFAADPRKYNEYVIASDDSLQSWHQKHFQLLKPWGERHLMVRELPEEKQRYYNVATAASITGFVRAHLFKAIQKCSGVLYCDTDSIAAHDTSSIDLGQQLGQWKKELQCTEYAIAGKKLYCFRGRKAEEAPEEWKIACKGVNLTAEQIVRVSEGERIVYTPAVPTYSFQRDEPIFINREVKRTSKDIRKMA